MLQPKSVSFLAMAAAMAFASSANAAADVSWNGANAIVDNTTSTTTLYETTVPDGTTYGRLVWDPLEATSPGISIDNDTPPNSPPGATGCILAGGAQCDDPRQSGKRFKLQATAPGPIDIMFDYQDDSSPSTLVDGIYRLFGKLTNAMARGMSGFSLELGTGVGDGFTRLSGNEGVSFYAPQNTPPKEHELAAIFPAGLFSPAGTPLPVSGEGFFSSDRSGFSLTYSPTLIQSTGIFGDYASIFGDAVLPLTAVPDGYFFDDDNDPSTEDVVEAWFDETTGTWLYGQANGFAAVDAMTLASWAGDPLFYINDIEDLANINLNTSIVFESVPAGQLTLRVNTTAAPVSVPPSIAMMGSVIVAGGILGALRRRNRKSN